MKPARILIINCILALFVLTNCKFVFADNSDFGIKDEEKIVFDYRNEYYSFYENLRQANNTLLFYELNTGAFNDFVNNPDISSLKSVFDNPDKGNIYEFSDSNENKYITRILLNQDKYYIDSGWYGVDALEGYFEIGKEWFEFINDDSLQSLLNSYGVTEKIEYKAFITQRDKDMYYLREPVILWIKTESQSFYLIYELNSFADFIQTNQYGFYDYNKFYNRFAIKNGSLKYKDITLNDTVIFQDKNFYVPARTVLNLFGTDVNWNGELRAIEFTANNIRYRYEIDKIHKLAMFFNGGWVYINSIDPRSCTQKDVMLNSVSFNEFIYNGTMYMQLYYFEKLSYVYNKKIAADFDNCIINIFDIDE